jgi:hypothetical protein
MVHPSAPVSCPYTVSSLDSTAYQRINTSDTCLSLAETSSQPEPGGSKTQDKHPSDKIKKKKKKSRRRQGSNKTRTKNQEKHADIKPRIMNQRSARGKPKASPVQVQYKKPSASPKATPKATPKARPGA